MKDQYVGDIGDYGKYSLLRAFSDAGVKIGVNWYLTKNDGSTDGKFTEYLKKDVFRTFDPLVFDALKRINEGGNRTVKSVQNSAILPGTLFFADTLNSEGSPKERVEKRAKWFRDSFYTLQGADLVFLDPDNGLLVTDNPSRKRAEKYAMPSEVREYWNAHHDVVYYCHRGRRTENQWQEYMNVMRQTIPEARIIVITYHKGTQRSYVFLIQPRHIDRYREIIDRVLKNWEGAFSDENVEDADHSQNTFLLATECFHKKRTDSHRSV